MSETDSVPRDLIVDFTVERGAIELRKAADEDKHVSESRLFNLNESIPESSLVESKILTNHPAGRNNSETRGALDDSYVDDPFFYERVNDQQPIELE